MIFPVRPISFTTPLNETQDKCFRKVNKVKSLQNLVLHGLYVTREDSVMESAVEINLQAGFTVFLLPVNKASFAARNSINRRVSASVTETETSVSN